jgi:hypothetical protein
MCSQRTEKNFVGINKKNKCVYPKNTNLSNINEKEFISELEPFIHSYMQKSTKKHSPVKWKKPNENGGFDTINLHSSKFDAWHQLHRKIRESIKNRPSNINRYNNLFNSKAIERTIARGAFLMSKNRSPIFNYGLLNSDDTYRIHVKDELYGFGAFILMEYNTLLNINENLSRQIKSLGKEIAYRYGFKEENLDLKKDKRKLISMIEKILKKIQPKTTDIRELENSIKKVIFGKDVSVGIDNFQLAWEELLSGAMKKVYSDKKVFVEEDMCNYSTDHKTFVDNIYPDLLLINKDKDKDFIQIIDAKYKDFSELSQDDWVKQIIYVHNFLNPEINKPKLEVDTNLYFIYPYYEGCSNQIEKIPFIDKISFEQIEIEKLQFSDKFICKKIVRTKLPFSDEFTCNKIAVDYMELLRIYNHSSKSKIFDFLNEPNTNKVKPDVKFKPWIPKLCINDKSKICTVDDGKYKKYHQFIYSLYNRDVTDKFFKTKKLLNEDNAKKDNKPYYKFTKLD